MKASLQNDQARMRRVLDYIDRLQSKFIWSRWDVLRTGG
jgi:hypothetical protein